MLELLTEGMSTQEIARSLFVSHQAVTYHVGNLLAKFQCANRAGMVARAYVLGIVSPSWPPRVDQRFLPGAGHAWKMCSQRLKDLQGRRTFV